MKQRSYSSLLLLVVSLVLASCAQPNVAATVDGDAISDGDVIALGTETSDGPTASAENFRNLLTNAIITKAIVAAAESEYGIGPLDTDQAIDGYVTSAGNDELSILQSVASNPQLSDDAVRLVAQQLLVRSVVKEQIASDPEYLQGVWQDNGDLLIQACASHILVPTEEEARAAYDRVAGGEDFAAVADEVSIDTGSPGGVLPCPVNPSVYVSPFSDVVATAPVGELAGPVETDFGWHVVRVDSREQPAALEDLAADPLKWIPDELLDAAWSNWLNDAVGASDIDVRSQIGTWYAPVDGIIPPSPSP